MAVLELYTFSSLNKGFLEQYRGTLAAADEAVIYFEKNAPITPGDIADAFDKSNLKICTDTKDLTAYLLQKRDLVQVFLLMSSGTFNGLDLNELSKKLIQ